MQIRALKTFNSKQVGLVREGMLFTVSDRYGQQLVKTGLAKPDVTPDHDKSLPGPDRRKEQARVEAGNEQRDDATAGSSQRSGGETRSEPAPESGGTENSSEDPPAGGRRRRSSSQPRGLRSPKRK